MFKLLISIILLLQIPASIQDTIKYPDKEDQLTLFRLRTKIAESQANMLQAQQQYEQAKKDLDQAIPQYNHFIDEAKKKLGDPPKGKVWITREDKDNALAFSLGDAPPANAKKD